MAGLPRQLHALADGRVGGNAIEKEKLKCAQSKRGKDLRIEFGARFLKEVLQLRVQPDLPAKHTEHQHGGQVAVGRRERVNSPRAQQVIRVSSSTLDGH